MNAVKQLIYLGYVFTVTEDKKIDCIYKSDKELNEYQILPLFEELKNNRLDVISYLQRLITVKIERIKPKTTPRTWVYNLEVKSYLGNPIKTYQIQNVSKKEFTDYFNKQYINNERFNNIRLSEYIPNHIVTYIAEDTQRVKIFDYSQISIGGLTSKEQLACPW